jgi:hypothetical protein
MKVRTIAAIAGIAVALSACGGGSGGRDPGFHQQFAYPNNPGFTLADLAPGEKISFRQHTGVVETRAVTQSTLDFDWTVNSSDENPAFLEILDPGLGINIRSVGQTVELDAALEGIASDGTEIAWIPAGSAFGLDYMDFGVWLASRPSAISRIEYGAGYLGLETPEEEMPTMGAASYDGGFVGVYGASGTGADGLNGAAEGLVHLDVDFGTSDLTGAITNISVVAFDGELNVIVDDFNDINLNATISGNSYTGSAVTGPAPVGSTIAFDEGLSGPLDGTFFGPADLGFPEETGGVLTIEDSANDAFISGSYGAALN